VTQRPFNVLLVEDHQADQKLTQRAFKSFTVPVQLHTVLDGVEAMAFLRQQGRFSTAPRPDLVLLDLNMPRKDGREVLREVGLDVLLATIPIIILTTSSAQTDVAMAYKLNANGYIVKPVSFKEFQSAMLCVEHYWLLLSELPG
jgi:chemotaxis family two-component system response regulator Rcp1